MKYLLSFILVFNFLSPSQNSFRTEQQKYSRVRTAYSEREEYVKDLLEKKGITNFSFDMFIRAFKHEEEFEIWVKKKTDTEYVLLKTYDICSSSGEPGPKRREGDFQVPEGVYHINHFNPFSNFYLSLGINYPNSSDRILGYKPSLGGAIYIHGSCVTIGCIPLTDDKIKEIYVLAVEAKNSGQSKIPVHIFPYRMDEQTNREFSEKYAQDTVLINFWSNLQSIYTYFETHKKNPSIKVNKEGIYYF